LKDTFRDAKIADLHGPFRRAPSDKNVLNVAKLDSSYDEMVLDLERVPSATDLRL
jgi:hypothetical protein